MNVCGIDLSSTCTGLCLPTGETTHYKPPAGTLLERAQATKRWLADWVLPADLVVIEDIGTRFVSAAIAAAYMHCVTDQLLIGTPVLKVSPAVLKRFAVGKGNADKHAMTVAAIRNGWACDGDAGSTDDEADAYWLHLLGLAMHGDWRVPESVIRAGIIGVLQGDTT